MSAQKPIWPVWREDVVKLFDQPEEYDLAAEIYSFMAAYEAGMTPQQAYDDFDAWTAA